MSEERVRFPCPRHQGEPPPLQTHLYSPVMESLYLVRFKWDKEFKSTFSSCSIIGPQVSKYQFCFSNLILSVRLELDADQGNGELPYTFIQLEKNFAECKD